MNHGSTTSKELKHVSPKSSSASSGILRPFPFYESKGSFVDFSDAIIAKGDKSKQGKVGLHIGFHGPGQIHSPTHVFRTWHVRIFFLGEAKGKREFVSPRLGM